jgi:putative acetyltransferase
MNILVRPETKEDYGAITHINDLAFGQLNEGELVKSMRERNNFITELSLIACFHNQAVGHILFSPIQVKNPNQSDVSLALAPMAVIPEFQGLGIGGLLIKNGFSAARRFGFRSVIVLGHPDYYPRFGFVPASRYSISPPFEAPDLNFMAIELVENGLKNVSGIVEYPEEFLRI